MDDAHLNAKIVQLDLANMAASPPNSPTEKVRTALIEVADAHARGSRGPEHLPFPAHSVFCIAMPSGQQKRQVSQKSAWAVQKEANGVATPKQPQQAPEASNLRSMSGTRKAKFKRLLDQQVCVEAPSHTTVVLTLFPEKQVIFGKRGIVMNHCTFTTTIHHHHSNYKGLSESC